MAGILFTWWRWEVITVNLVVLKTYALESPGHLQKPYHRLTPMGLLGRLNEGA